MISTHFLGHREKVVYSTRRGVQMGTRRRRFHKQFKLDALRMIEESNRPIASIARDL